jgi:hypothetical protein
MQLFGRRARNVKFKSFLTQIDADERRFTNIVVPAKAGTQDVARPEGPE